MLLYLIVINQKKGRFCPNINDTHGNNNQYLVFNIREGKLFQRCRDTECKYYFRLIFDADHFKLDDIDDIDDTDDIIPSTDDGHSQ